MDYCPDCEYPLEEEPLRVHWLEDQFRHRFTHVQPVRGRSRLKGRLHWEMGLRGGYYNHVGYLQQGGLVVVTVYGPTGTPWKFSPHQERCYGLNPDGSTYPWHNTERRVL